MDAVYLHLVLNHIPVWGTIFGFVLLLVGFIRRSDDLQRAGLITFVVVAVLTIPVYLSGRAAYEPMEEFLADIDPAAEGFIDQHEAAGLIAFLAVIVLGVVALGALLQWQRAEIARRLVIVSLVLGVIVGGIVGWTANIGGQIRHTEIRAGFQPPER
ncbi:MAG: hypothetical protein RMJ96_02400 [Candidatus Bipolaricaulota bacterium]|nr:hypothetical protein [Candidatus Bipolaricaulota bacterium]MDW8110441.1 hypothetical protein [Candidatus Bipolaricaulota bacterium]